MKKENFQKKIVKLYFICALKYVSSNVKNKRTKEVIKNIKLCVKNSKRLYSEESESTFNVDCHQSLKKTNIKKARFPAVFYDTMKSRINMVK